MTNLPQPALDAINAAIKAVRALGIRADAMVSFAGYVPLTDVAAPLPPPPPVVYATPPAAPLHTLYVSPTGKDGNAGTLAAPVATAHVEQSFTAIYFERGGTYPCKGLNFSNLTDITLASYGDPTKAEPVILIAPNVDFYSDSTATARICIKELEFDSAWTWAATAAGYRYHQASADWGNPHGADLTFDFSIANLKLGPCLSGCKRVDIRLNGTDPLGVTAQRLMILDCDSGRIRGDYGNSSGESCLRATGPGVRNVVFDVAASQQLDPAHGRTIAPKSAIEFRSIHNCSGNLTATNGTISFDTDRTGLETENDCSFNITITNSHLDIKPGASNLKFSGSISVATGEPCVAISCEPNAGIVFDGMKFINPKKGAIEAFAGGKHTTVRNSTYTPGQPLFFGAPDGVIDGGGNKSAVTP